MTDEHNERAGGSLAEKAFNFYVYCASDSDMQRNLATTWRELPTKHRTAYRSMVEFVFREGQRHAATSGEGVGRSPFAFQIGECVESAESSGSGRVVARFDFGDLAPPSYRVLTIDEYGDLTLELEDEANLFAVKVQRAEPGA